MKRTVALLMLFLFLFVMDVHGEERDLPVLKEIADDAVSFFAPLSGYVTSTDEKNAYLDIGKNAGVRKGMRLKVFRKGDEFRHPVTGEPLGKIEKEVGDVEVLSVEDDSSVVTKVSGEVRAGDRVRISRGSMKVLFYQTRQVDWGVGDGLFRALKKTGRFDIEEDSKDRDNPKAMVEEVRNSDAVFGVFVRQLSEEDQAVVRISFYHPDGKQFYKKEIHLSEEEIGKLKFGYDYLKQVDVSSQWVFEVSSSMEKITSCDVDGDGKQELVAVSGDTLQVITLDHAPKTIYQKETGGEGEVIWLDCGDLNDDGRAEMTVTFMEGYEEPDEEAESTRVISLFNTVNSRIFALRNDALEQTAYEEGFMRIVEHVLYVQDFDREMGFSGNVFSAEYKNGIGGKKEAHVPAGANIYDFYTAGEGTFVIDNAAYLNLEDGQGRVVWRSGENLGGFIHSYRKASLSPIIEKGRWEVKDRIVPYAGSLLIIKRIPTAETASGLGYSSTDIMEISIKEGKVSMTPVLAGLDGTIHDFTVLDDKLVILVRHGFGRKVMDLFKGESPFKRNIYMFPLSED